MENILDQLNESQRKAVEYCDGAEIVIAGAGSGKTRVLTYKIAYLLKHGYMPWNILALTFTNKAAKEMKERIGNIVGHDMALRLNMGTFHSVFARILRIEAEKMGYSSSFTIYDQTDSRQLVKSIIKELSLDDKAYKPSTVADRISMAKNHLLTPIQYAQGVQARIDEEHKIGKVKDIFQRYCERCKQANVMDFDDLLLNTYLLFKNNEDVRLKYAEHFEYVLVDEYQDTNYAQQEIIQQLTRDRQLLCVVGDDAQSIYSFRGANLENMLKFTSLYDNVKMFKLEQNYRSTQLIVQAANSLIKHNQMQIPKNVFSKQEKGERLQFKQAYSDKEEALIVCKDIKRILREDGCGYGDFAILYRTNSQSRNFEEYMRKEEIPYRIYGGLSFYQRKEIKDAIAYFRLVTNPDDEEAFRRVINYPTRGIGNVTVSKIVDAAVQRGVSLWTVVSEPEHNGLSVGKSVLSKLGNFKDMVDGWINRREVDDAYVLGQDILRESGMTQDIYGGSAPEDLARQENVNELLSGMQDFVDGRREEGLDSHVSLNDFLQEVSLMTDTDSDEKDNGPKVSLMTIHSAKGLEFPTVFIVGLEENVFPSPMSCNSIREMEEERRLFYVAITRAERHCILTCAQNRYRYGRMEYDTPSRFLRDLDATLIASNMNGLGSKKYDTVPLERSSMNRVQKCVRSPRPVIPQVHAMLNDKLVASPGGESSMSLSSTVSVAGGLAIGSKVEHLRFGIGRVLAIDGHGENLKAKIIFENAGEKQLLLKFARLKVGSVEN